MKSFLLLFSVFAMLSVSAQKVRNAAGAEASWKVLWGKKVLLKASAEDETANVISIKRSDLNKKATFALTYNASGEQQSGWKRSITAYDTQDNVLRTVNSNILSMSAASLKRLAKGRSEIRIYTMAVPSDPSRAAVVRVRRVHLVTIRLV